MLQYLTKNDIYFSSKLHKKYLAGIFPQDLNFSYYAPQEINSDNLQH